MVSVVSSILMGDNFIYAETLKPLNVNFVQKCQKCQIFVFAKNLECVRMKLSTEERNKKGEGKYPKFISKPEPSKDLLE